ncbi:hypothetical protein GCM10007880_65900 [Mesorhizobium amorphae]|nr:hypothetical protein GCM10007880_65900 [Mesorhizobium amorphae]
MIVRTALRDVIVAKSMAEPLQDMLDAHTRRPSPARHRLAMPAAGHLPIALRGAAESKSAG